MLKGGCHCGAIRYEARGEPFYRTHCHCTTCRATTGAPCVAWFSVEHSHFRFVTGVPARYASSEHAERCFCTRCGTQLAFHSRERPDEIDVTTASLDDPEQVPPEDHTYVSSRLSWVPIDETLPQYAKARPG